MYPFPSLLSDTDCLSINIARVFNGIHGRAYAFDNILSLNTLRLTHLSGILIMGNRSIVENSKFNRIYFKQRILLFINWYACHKVFIFPY